MLEGTERWIPGPEPVEESIELYATHAEESKFYAWRLHLSPQGRSFAPLSASRSHGPPFDGETLRLLRAWQANRPVRREQL